MLRPSGKTRKLPLRRGPADDRSIRLAAKAGEPAMLQFHVAISLVGILSGLVMLYGLLIGNGPSRTGDRRLSRHNDSDEPQRLPAAAVRLRSRRAPSAYCRSFCSSARSPPITASASLGHGDGSLSPARLRRFISTCSCSSCRDSRRSRPFTTWRRRNPSVPS